MFTPELFADLQLRWSRLQKIMIENNIGACLLMGNENLFYVSGRVFAGCFYLPAEGKPFFFVRRPVGLVGDNVISIQKLEQIPDLLNDFGVKIPSVVMLEGQEIGYQDWQRLEKLISPAKTVNGTTLVRKARSIKTAYEIEQIRQSGILHSAVYQRIPDLYKPGMTDVDLSIEIEHELRCHGSLGVFRVFGSSMEIFMGSVLTGDNAGAPSPYDFSLGGSGQHLSIPIGENGSPLLSGNTVQVDANGNFTGYNTDMTRTFAIGKIPDKAYSTHQVALDIQQRILELAKPGMPVADTYNETLKIVAHYKLDNCFMGTVQQAKFVGHGVGIEINELPVLTGRSKEIFEEGMVIAVEPKFILEGIGAVGTENTFVIGKNGAEQLTSGSDAILRLPA